MVKWLLLETRLGDLLLALLERWTGLAVVPLVVLCDEPNPEALADVLGHVQERFVARAEEAGSDA